jgi:hypothetical protein
MARKEGDKQTNREVLVEKKHEARSKAKDIVHRVPCEDTYVACLSRPATARSSFTSWNTDESRADRVYYRVAQGPRQNE